MEDIIKKYLYEARPWKKGLKKVREMVADHFGGTIVGRFVKIADDEYLITVNPEEPTNCGYDVRKMIWTY